MSLSVQRSVQEHFKSSSQQVTVTLILATLVGSKDYSVLASTLEDKMECVLLQGHNVVAFFSYM